MQGAASHPVSPTHLSSLATSNLQAPVPEREWGHALYEGDESITSAVTISIHVFSRSVCCSVLCSPFPQPGTGVSSFHAGMPVVSEAFILGAKCNHRRRSSPRYEASANPGPVPERETKRSKPSNASCSSCRVSGCSFVHPAEHFERWMD